jgi:hypothetical protein
VTGPVTARLSAVAAWDVPPVRRAVNQLDEAAARLMTWRARVEGVGRSLESGECWSGPAARSAVRALHDLSATTSAVEGGLARSLHAYVRLVAEAATAQELAGDALAAAVLPAQADPEVLGRLTAGLPGGPVVAASETALEHAAAATVAARDTGEALAALGVRDAFAPADFSDLPGHGLLTAPGIPPVVPVRRPPDEVAAWWSGLSEAAQRAVIASSPAVLGALDGVPAWARDRANRRVLDRALTDPRVPAAAALTADVVARRIAAEEADGQVVQLQLLDLAGDRVVLALGDLDTADAVAVMVPGINNSPANDLSALAGDARDVGAAARAAAPGLSVATVVWLGYRPPGFVGAVRPTAAWRGGPALASALAGLASARVATGDPDPRTTVLAHSYGTRVVDVAADSPGILCADAVVLLGSPGMQEDARSLEAPEVFDAASPNDPISTSGFFGSPTYRPSYGSTGLRVTPFMGHSDYYDPDYPTLAAIGEVVAGHGAPN